MQRWILLVALIWAATAQGQNYFLQGSATNTGPDCYQLTPAIGTQTGAVWYAAPIDLTQPFNISFEIGLGSLDGNGADGIMFVLQLDGTDAIGQSGGGLGFLGFNTAFGVEFDTWQNGDYGDPTYDHIGCVSDGSVDHTTATAFGAPVAMIDGFGNGEDGQNHIGQITWDPATQLVSVAFDCDVRLVEQVDLINDVFGGESEVWWGFTGSTGGSFNVQTVCLQANSLTTPSDVTLCPGDSIQLNVVGSSDGSYQWSPPDYLSDPTAPNPWCVPEATVQYTIQYTGLCGQALTADINVAVEPLEMSLLPDGPYVLTCNEPVLNLQVDANYSGVDYTWSTSSPDGFVSSGGASAVVNSGGTVTILGSAAGGLCTDEIAVDIAVDQTAFTAVLSADADQIDCNTPTVSITAVPDDASAELSWSASGGGAFTGGQGTVAADAPGTFTCTVLNPSNGCTSTASWELTADLTLPVVEAGSVDTLTCKDPTWPVEGASIGPADYTATFEWTWEDGAGGMSQTHTLSPTAHTPGWHYLEVVLAENGCAGIDSVFVYQDPDAAVDASSLTLPNVMTPGSDGRNDTFRAFLADDPSFEVLGVMERYTLQVFNRWGNLVYQNAGLPIRWDATDSGGNPINPGTYYVLLDWRITCGGVQEGQATTELEVFRP